MHEGCLFGDLSRIGKKCLIKPAFIEEQLCVSSIYLTNGGAPPRQAYFDQVFHLQSARSLSYFDQASMTKLSLKLVPSSWLLVCTVTCIYARTVCACMYARRLSYTLIYTAFFSSIWLLIDDHSMSPKADSKSARWWQLASKLYEC